MRVAAGVITACSYYNSAFYYSRTMAISGRRRMLISSGDSLRTLSSILSGEGLDEGEQRESPLVSYRVALADNGRFSKFKCAKSVIPVKAFWHGTIRYAGARCGTHTKLDTVRERFGFDKVNLG
jgi:hypothetical protein